MTNLHFLPVSALLLGLSTSAQVASHENASLGQPAGANPALVRSSATSKSYALQNQSKTLLPALVASYGKMPLSFEANQGQLDPQVRFLARGRGYSLLLTNSSAVLALTKGNGSGTKPDLSHGLGKSPLAATSVARSETDVVRMELVGTTPGVRVSGAEKLPGTANYYAGADSSKWHTNIPTYTRVQYRGIYPGVDLVYYGNQGQLEYDFLVAPGADAKPVRLHFAGARNLALNRDGDLKVSAMNGAVVFHKPVVYQIKDGIRAPVKGRFTLLAKNSVGFELGSYDHHRALVIDPELAYSTYLGGGVEYFANAVAVSPGGDAYVIGATVPVPTYHSILWTTKFPLTPGALGYGENDCNLFVTKLDRQGAALIYSACIGGAEYSATTTAIALDSSGNIYLTGSWSGTGLPVTSGAFQQAPKSTETASAFVAKLNPSGSALVYCTYLGGSGSGSSGDFGSAIAVDSLGQAYVTGSTSSPDFPTTSHAYLKSRKSPSSAFVTKLNPEGSALVYSTYLGGSPQPINNGQVGDYGYAIAIDASGSAYVAGATAFTDFPVTAGAFQTVNNDSFSPYYVGYNGFITKFNPEGSELIYSTYLGGSVGNEAFCRNCDEITAIALDDKGYAYVGGGTASTDFPVTTGAFQSVNQGSVNGFVGKLNPTGTALVYSTYLGGPDIEGSASRSKNAGYVLGLAIDKNGDAFVTGSTYSLKFPVTPDAFQSINKGQARKGTNPFLTELDPAGSSLLYSTYFGGSGIQDFDWDQGTGIALDALGNVYMAGNTYSLDFPITGNAYQVQNNAGGTEQAEWNDENAYVAKFAFNGATATTLATSGSPQTVGGKVTFTASVTAVAGGAQPEGAVGFRVNGQLAAEVPLDADGRADYSTSGLATGQQRIGASFVPGTSQYSVSGAGLTQTMLGTVAAPAFSPPGGTYAYVPLVTIANATPGATLFYTTDGSTPGAGSTVYTAPFYVRKPVNVVNAIAMENGDAKSPVVSATYTYLETAIKTTAAIQSSLNPSIAGQAVTFSLTVKAASGPTPTGTVTFMSGSNVIGTAALSEGVASFTTSSLPGGSQWVTGFYGGNAIDSHAPAPGLTQVFDPNP